jgi:hypothetical protein
MKSPRKSPDTRKQILWRASPAEVKQLLDLVKKRTETQNLIISKAIDRMYVQEMAEGAGEALALADDVRPYSEPDGVCPSEEELAQEAATYVESCNQLERRYTDPDQ